MKPGQTRPSAQVVKALKANSIPKATQNQLPRDPDGLFKRAAARAKKVTAMYDDLNPGLGRDYIVENLLFDLMHLCDRDAKLGGFDNALGFAVQTYYKFIEENELMVG
ncbi:MAG: hypothetical protein WA085_05310 [Sphingobium sp.]